MKNIVTFFLMLFAAVPSCAQQLLSLDSCRAMALRNNKQLGISRLKQDVARYTRKAARTKYLPHVDVVGGYEFMSKEISILSDGQKTALKSIGTTASGQIGTSMSSILSEMVSGGVITQEMAQALGNVSTKTASGIQEAGNSIGKSIVDAFDTDTKNIFSASVMLTQPIYMGGSIIAANKIAAINEQLAANDIQNTTQNTIYSIDNAYWTVVSLKNKEKLAQSYLGLVKRLSDDVHKMIREGVATRADGLKVDVKVNEAEMQLTQVENGLSLSKMLLCQLCGLPVSNNITLEDEEKESIAASDETTVVDMETAKENRSEMKMLQNAIDISRQSTNLIRAAYLPQVALTAGYLVTNPSLYNGFENKFSGVWNIGVLVRVPVWNWFEGTYKIRASKAATSIAQLEYDEAGEKIELQINQSSYKVSEANKKLAMAHKNTESADENLRCANLGFKEGVMDVTDVMAAQTAWLQARSQKIDAEIDLKLSQINLKKVMGEKLY
ncbi:MAG: TolC family protein [Prevotellaceae bacterium]|nr:TolC family protein [Prevotellaceae bacterium]